MASEHEREEDHDGNVSIHPEGRKQKRGKEREPAAEEHMQGMLHSWAFAHFAFKAREWQ
jgi:hypothetical protein